MCSRCYELDKAHAKKQTARIDSLGVSRLIVSLIRRSSTNFFDWQGWREFHLLG